MNGMPQDAGPVQDAGRAGGRCVGAGPAAGAAPARGARGGGETTSYQQIAEACAVPVDTVRSRLNQARTALAQAHGPQ
ncbi:sigma factor-like helix-turn-helix DNA-binding protein [Streptomyces sp. NPDC051104]|uniref:sigma factor-like helix-turn-helix DNA-binding protein n=1 Tax=Streptomyces sp. NPDC051104 TaxID=3155044 RepID=UPI003428C785